MLSTLEDFSRQSSIVQGLWIDESDYDWQAYPVVRIDFSLNTIKDAATLQVVIDNFVEEIAAFYGVEVQGFDYQSRFRDLLLQLSRSQRLSS